MSYSQAAYDPAYWENLRANDGDIPHRIDRARFWELLEVLPPANWRDEPHFECFRLIECQTADLYTWCVRLGREDSEECEYWEMIAPRSSSPGALMLGIEIAKRKETDHA